MHPMPSPTGRILSGRVARSLQYLPDPTIDTFWSSATPSAARAATIQEVR